MNYEDLMLQAVAFTHRGIAQGQAPFGALIWHAGEVLALAHNTVFLDHDPTAHAEINAIRAASMRLGCEDLSGAVLFSTCEPCPMCLAATHWSGIRELVFGTGIEDAEAIGSQELKMPARTLAATAAEPIQIRSEVCRTECLGLFEEFVKRNPEGLG